jgi:protein TonB
MLHGLLLVAAALGAPGVVSPDQSVEARNGEFIFKNYPPRALANGEQGTVKFRTAVNEKGVAMDCEVIQSSGHFRLDRETCDLIINRARFAPVIADGKAREAVHEGLVNWRIPGAPVSAGIKVKYVSQAPDKVICKRSQKTGSLVTHTRLCLTMAEWERYETANQEEIGALQGRKGSTRGN